MDAKVIQPPVTVWFINGPPRSGKDTAGKLLAAMLGNAVVLKFATPLKLATHAAMAIFNGKKEVAPIEHYDAVKDDETLEEFFGVSPRECYIQMSEMFSKPLFGNSFFGRLMIKQIEAAKAKGIQHMVITDCGFEVELAPVKAMYGAENCHLIQITRPGCGFDGDSRSYVFDETIANHSVHNIGTTGDLRVSLAQVLQEVEDGEAIPF